jgi:hypothetical protein
MNIKIKGLKDSIRVALEYKLTTAHSRGIWQFSQAWLANTLKVDYYDNSFLRGGGGGEGGGRRGRF